MSANHPFVVWAGCVLWLLSIFATGWSLLLFFYVDDILFYTGTDLVNALVLLSGIVMLPTNFYIIHSIANNKKIDHTAKLLCCRLWMCIVWIIVINLVGTILSIRRLYSCNDSTVGYIHNSIRQYKHAPRHKKFIDDVQWSLKCCGLNSYNDWFTVDWHDKIRDYEWEPMANLRNKQSKREAFETDSVPLSCCKSGSCVSSYLRELGTHSIHTHGCGHLLYRIILMSMNFHLVMFLTVIFLEILMLKYISDTKKIPIWKKKCNMANFRHVMPVRENFHSSSGSCQYALEDSDEIEVQQYEEEN